MYYSTWLHFQERDIEAQAVADCALNLATSNPTLSLFTSELFNLQTSLLRKGPGGTQAAIAAMCTGMNRLPEAQRPTLYCDLAFYTATLKQADTVDHWMGRARDAFERVRYVCAAENTYYRISLGRSLIELGRPLEAMKWLPEAPVGPDDTSTIFPLLYWSQALIAAGEKDAAIQHIGRLNTLITTHGTPLSRRQWKALTQNL
jgi:hypothetical protein